ncbi:hypothetical protein MUK51_08820 [Sphingobacterium faecium]|uniref:hypothetical protein n=1 Tax=Sphingobacterium faecium TaxID=34087 RepID=UPI0021B5B5A3|nr:hypothetical protein [Sphingobacterium faecium]UXD71383.1 hypothetical protein MUK51_08820 [Sphingobacterium faecium]
MKTNSILEKISTILDNFFKEDSITKLQELTEGMVIDFVCDKKSYLSFSFDKQLPANDFPKGLFPFFNRGEAKVTSFCDYIIFTEEKNKLFILLIELKKGRSNTTKQLEAGKCFSEFLVATLNRVYGVNINPEIRKISVRETHVKPKQKQKPIKYNSDGFHTFCNSKFWLKKYLI